MNYKVCPQCGTKNYAAVLTHREELDPTDWTRNMIIEEHRFDVCKHLDQDYQVVVVGYKSAVATGYRFLAG